MVYGEVPADVAGLTGRPRLWVVLGVYGEVPGEVAGLTGRNRLREVLRSSAIAQSGSFVSDRPLASARDTAAGPGACDMDLFDLELGYATSRHGGATVGLQAGGKRARQ